MTGWQQLPEPPKPRECLHLGVSLAQFSAHRFAEGSRWLCTCGREYVVVSNGGKDKKLVPRGSDA